MKKYLLFAGLIIIIGFAFFIRYYNVNASPPPPPPCTIVYVTVTGNFGNCSWENVKVGYTLNGVTRGLKPYTGNGTYQFDAASSGNGTLCPIITGYSCCPVQYVCKTGYYSYQNPVYLNAKFDCGIE